MMAISIRDAFNIDVPATAKTKAFADASHPLIPVLDSNHVFDKSFVREFLAFLAQPMGDAMFVSGPTGSGKTSGVCQIAARLNWPVQEMTCSNRMEATDLIGFHTMAAPAPGLAPEMKFMYGPLAIAMKHGHILLLNEVDMVEPGELAALNDVLEGRPLTIAQNGGEVVHPHPKFRVVVTANSLGQGDETGQYHGVMMQNMASLDRYRFAVVNYLEPVVEQKILANVAPDIHVDLREKMVAVANEVRNAFTGDVDGGSQLSFTMSTRTLVRWARLALQFRSSTNDAGERNQLSYALHQSLLRRVSPSEKEAVLQLCRSHFGDVWHD
ncbi:AAA family ATPase [Halomonas casei]|uniref:AAA family ATPase n=1 Tax=Halomonas casei TaxID=2742613 RepID=UPI003CF547F1